MKNQKRIIILHNDPINRSRLKKVVSESGHIPYCFENITTCLENFNTLSPDLVILRPNSLAKTSRFVNFIKAVDFKMPLLMIGADAAIRGFVASNRFDNVRFERSGCEPYEIKSKINEFAFTQGLRGAADSTLIVGNSPEIVKLRKLCSEISRATEAVLICGEAGTGKDLVARTLHRWSPRKEIPLYKLNVGALDGQHFSEQGTSLKKSGEIQAVLSDIDAISEGQFESTLFFDGVEHMSLPFQTSLESYLNRTDAENSKTGNASKTGRHIIASTSIDLEALVENGQFSKDLFCHLSVFTIQIPPLRKHPEDIPLLVDYISDVYCQKVANGVCEIPESSKRLLQGYSWPGNMIELENAVKKFIDSGFDKNSIEHLAPKNGIDSNNPAAVFKTGIEEQDSFLNEDNAISMKGIRKQVVAKMEKKLIKEALRYNNWNRKKSARMLDISYRSLLNKIKEYGIV